MIGDAVLEPPDMEEPLFPVVEIDARNRKGDRDSKYGISNAGRFGKAVIYLSRIEGEGDMVQVLLPAGVTVSVELVQSVQAAVWKAASETGTRIHPRVIGFPPSIVQVRPVWGVYFTRVLCRMLREGIERDEVLREQRARVEWPKEQPVINNGQRKENTDDGID